jgi:hypothetical protein
LSGGFYSIIEMHCSVCGRKYPWTVNFGYSKSRTCGRECNEEFNWREYLSTMGLEYYEKPKTGDECPATLK